MSDESEVLKVIEKNIDLNFLHQFMTDTELNELVEKYKKEKLDEETIMKIVIDSMVKAEKIKGLTGEQKKKIAENLIQNTFVSLIKSGFNILISFVPILSLLSPLIDLIISATKGLLDINNVKKCCSKIFPCCKPSETKE